MTASRSRFTRFLSLGVGFLCATAAPSGATRPGIVPVGAGSYTTQRPPTVQTPPREIFRTAGLSGPVPTNQWWSSLIWQRYSQNMFPHPLAMVCHSKGLAVTYPGAAINSASGNIMGGGVSAEGDFVIGNSAITNAPQANCAGYSDWFVTAEFAEGGARLRTSFGHGSPFVFCLLEGGQPTVTFPERPQIWAGEAGNPVLGLTIRGRHYALFGASRSTWSGTDGLVFRNETDKAWFSVALLPDNSPDTLALFTRHAHCHVVDTRAVPAIKGGTLETEYRFTTRAMEGGATGTLFALYPHQWKYAAATGTGHAYRSVRGIMKLGAGTSFRTSVPIQGLLPMLPAAGIPDRERMLGYLRQEAARKSPPFKDTYWEGKHLGNLATLSGIAETAGAPDLQREFLGEIRRRLENWFQARPGEQSPLFFYDPQVGTLIGSKPSYGSDSQLNDHHFHYGYFIRAAGEVARHDPAWARDWGPMVRLLIRDIASPSTGDPLFPHLRCFDVYAGHSWASGLADFADGNNQESSSESMNAWYGLMLWGEATGDTLVRDTGIYLYNTERTAVEEYWFDVSGTNFPEDFPNVALGMIWGGKGAFATWFSGDIDCIHGINWLPFTPASIYMGRHPDYVKKNHDRIVAKREKGNDYNNGWGDLIVMFYALHDPSAAADYIETHPDCSLEGGNTHAFMSHWIHTLDRLGRNDSGLTANHPWTNVYRKNGRNTYAAYHFGAEPLEVRFSDGFTLTAVPGTLTTATESPP